jgi:hypothetical protein
LVLGPSHAKNLAGHLRQIPAGTESTRAVVDAAITAQPEYRRNSN